jgi:hypothetical protein
MAEARCPRCGAELWVLALSEGPAFFPRRPAQTLYEFLAALPGPLFGLSARQVEAGFQDADQLDVVEMLAEVEEALRSPPP